jgi:hypothetical protein
LLASLPSVRPNPSLNPDPLRQAPQARAEAHGASSQPGLTAPASAVRLARTLGRHRQAEYGLQTNPQCGTCRQSSTPFAQLLGAPAAPNYEHALPWPCNACALRLWLARPRYWLQLCKIVSPSSRAPRGTRPNPRLLQHPRRARSPCKATLGARSAQAALTSSA